MHSPAFTSILLLLSLSSIFVTARPPYNGPPPISAGDGCCCCDISAGPAISCDRSIPDDQCICADVVCPADATTIWHSDPVHRTTTTTNAVTPTALATSIRTAPVHHTTTKGATSTTEPGNEDIELTGKKVPCCCCNIRISKTVCQLKKQEDCICADVICPPGAPTIFIGPTATPGAASGI